MPYGHHHLTKLIWKNNISAINHVAYARYFDRIMNIVIDVLMGWDKKLQCPSPCGGLFGFYKRLFASTFPNDMGTSMPTSWCIPMARQPIPLGFYNLLKIQTPPLWTASLHIKQHFYKWKYPFRKGLFFMIMLVLSEC